MRFSARNDKTIHRQGRASSDGRRPWSRSEEVIGSLFFKTAVGRDVAEPIGKLRIEHRHLPMFTVRTHCDTTRRARTSQLLAWIHSTMTPSIMSKPLRFLLSLLAMTSVVQALPSPASPVAAPVFGHDKIFGIARRVPSHRSSSSCQSTIVSLRGGQVIEPETLEEVESILVRAGSEGKLVVIDFSATW